MEQTKLYSLRIVSALIIVLNLQYQLPAQKSAGGLFDIDSILSISLKGNLRALLNDRTGTPASHKLILSCTDSVGSEINIPVEMKTRGRFRRMKENCTYPPLQIRFAGNSVHTSTVFKKQEKLKLVMPCSGDEYVIREWLVYKIYNLITPFSFRARLVKLTLVDDRNKKPAAPFYGMLLEEENQMAARNNLKAVEPEIKPEHTDVNTFLTLAVFEYLIGNTDWSVQYLQNIKLLSTDGQSRPFPIPYDFDHAGIVEAPYAQPHEELLLSSVRERRYRGYCVQDLAIFESIIAEFNRLKNDIYKIYTSNPLLNEKYIQSATRYLDEFYKTINTAKAWQKEFAYPCDKKGTGNVIIKGLKEGE